jgi:hypothetical protein
MTTPVTCPTCEAPVLRADARFCRACGAALPTEPPAIERPSAPRGRRRLRTLLTVAAALAVLALISGGIRTLQANTTDPVDPVEDLLALISASEGDRIADLLDVDSPLVTDQALAQGYTPPEQMRTTDVTYGQADTDTHRPTKNTAAVGVSYRLGEETHTAQVRVQREPTGWVRSWELADRGDQIMGALALTSAHLEDALVADTAVRTAPPGSTPTTVTALPGTYSLSVGEDDPLFEPSDLAALTVRGSGSSRQTEVTIPGTDLIVRPELLGEVEDQVEDHLQECAQATTLTSAGCPLRVEQTIFRTTTDVEWTLDTPPVLTITAAEDVSLHGAPLTVQTLTPGSATAEWTYAYTDDDPETATIDVNVAGSVLLDPQGDVVWQP